MIDTKSKIDKGDETEGGTTSNVFRNPVRREKCLKYVQYAGQSSGPRSRLS
jgi:hypothetical protein